MLNSLNWQVQELFVSKLSAVSVLLNNNIQVYTSVPSGAKLPYVRISNISASKNMSLTKQVIEFTFVLDILTKSKSNRMLLELVEVVYRELPILLTGAVDNSLHVAIDAVTGANYNIAQDVNNALWLGNYSITLIAKEL